MNPTLPINPTPPPLPGAASDPLYAPFTNDNQPLRVEVVSGGGAGTSATEAKQDSQITLMNSILTEMRDNNAIDETIWADYSTPNAPIFYVRRATVNADTGAITVTFHNADGTTATPTVGNLVLATANKDYEIFVQRFVAIAGNAPDYAIGDIVNQITLINTTDFTATPNFIYVNPEIGLPITPNLADLAPIANTTTIQTSAKGITTIGSPTSTNASADRQTLDTTLYGATGVLTFPTASSSADAEANGTSRTSVKTMTYGYNGSTWDRNRNIIGADNTTGTGILATGIVAHYDTTPNTIADGNYGTMRMDSDRVLFTRENAGTSWTHAAMAATGFTLGFATAKVVNSYNIENPNGRTVYVSIFDKATAPLAADTAIYVLAVPPGGFLDLTGLKLKLTNGFSYGVTTVPQVTGALTAPALPLVLSFGGTL